VPQVIKLSHKFVTNTDLDLVTVWHWKYTGGAPLNADLNSWLSAISNGFTTHLQALMPTNVTHVMDTATDLSSPSAGQAVQTHTQVGTRAGAILPLSTCAMFNGLIQRRYRGGKMRNYWPFGVESDLADDAHWSQAALTAFNAGIAAMIQQIAGAPAGPATISSAVSVSYYSGVNPPITLPSGRVKQSSKLGPSPPFPYVDPVTQYVCNPVLGTQRRRLRPG
jgi:hypothetical protein